MTKQILRILFMTGLFFISLRAAIASNNSSDTPGSSSTSSIIYGTFLLLVSFLAVLCNGVVVFVILKTDNPDVSSLSIYAHMAFWDLIFGLFSLIFATPSAFFDRLVYSESMISWLACFGSFLSGVTVFNTVTIVTDRFISLKWPFLHRKHATKWTYASICVCVYIMAFIRTLLIVLPDSDCIYDHTTAICRPTFNTYQGKLASSGPVALSFGMIIVFVCYILLLRAKRRRRVRSELVVPMSRNVMKRSLICVLSAGVFCFSYLPVFLWVAMDVAVADKLLDDILAKFATVAFVSNSIWNVLIYSMNYKPFRDASLKMFCRSYYRRIKRQSELRKANRTKVSRVHVRNTKTVLAGNSSVSPIESEPRANT